MMKGDTNLPQWVGGHFAPCFFFLLFCNFGSLFLFRYFIATLKTNNLIISLIIDNLLFIYLSLIIDLNSLRQSQMAPIGDLNHSQWKYGHSIKS